MSASLLRLGLILSALALNGCAALTAVGAGVAGAKAAWDLAHQTSADFSAAIAEACHEWQIAKAATEARIELHAVPQEKAKRIGILAKYADAACDPNHPPPGSPLATAVWLGGIALEARLLSGEKQ